MRGRSLSGCGLGIALAACGGATPRPPHAAAPVVVEMDAPESAPTAAAAPTNQAPRAVVEHRTSWYGLSLDLSDAWEDDTSFGFQAPQRPIERLSFVRSELQPAQIPAWLEEVRSRVDGAYGATPLPVERFENATFSVLGVHIPIKTESLYNLFATVDDQVINITFMCRAECDATVRGIVRSLNRPAAAGAVAKAQQRYSVMGLVFDSAQPFDLPSYFTLVELGAAPDTNPHRITCGRSGSPPDDSSVPAEIGWAYEGNKALAQVPRSEETLLGKPGNAGNAITLRLYRREGFVPDELGTTVFATSSTAVIPLGRDYFVCNLPALPSSAALLTRFHRLFESARSE